MKFTFLSVSVLVACSKDAPPDASACNGLKQLDCDVTVDCSHAISHTAVTLCDKSNDAAEIEAKANSTASDQIVCTGGAQFAATCTAAPGALTCPTGFELEDVTVCIPGMTYDVDTSGICSHLPATDDQCGHACDRQALYAFATDGKFTIYACSTTDGRLYQVGAAPITGNGARCLPSNHDVCPLSAGGNDAGVDAVVDAVPDA